MKTLDEVIESLEKVDATWSNVRNLMNYEDFRDALTYLRDYRDLLQTINKAHAIIAYYLEKDLQK